MALAGNRVLFSVTGLDGVIEALHALPAEVVSKKGGPVRVAVFKAAKHVRDVEIEEFDRAIAKNKDKNLSTGLVRKNIVSRRSRWLLSGKGERYVVKIQKKFYPRNDNTQTGSKPTTLKSVHLMEYGSEKQDPNPFILPAFRRSQSEAFTIMVNELDIGIAKIVRKLNKKPRRVR